VEREYGALMGTETLEIVRVALSKVAYGEEQEER
jgi:hypothetical protein